jgi:hypothetical protein
VSREVFQSNERSCGSLLRGGIGIQGLEKNTVSRRQVPCLLSIVIAANCALLFAIATDELFNGLNSNEEIAVGLCVKGPVLLNIWEFPHRSRQSSYHTQLILTNTNPFAWSGVNFLYWFSAG